MLQNTYVKYALIAIAVAAAIYIVHRVSVSATS